MISSSDGVTWTIQPDWPAAKTIAVGDALIAAADQQLFVTGPLVFPPVVWPNSLRRRMDGQVWIMVDADPGQVLTLQGSQNLLDWTPLGQVTNQVSTFDLIDQSGPAFPHRFYRVKR